MALLAYDNSMLVKDWMTPEPITVNPETPVLEALKIIKEHNFRRLPVMDGNKLVGITTRKDLKDAMPSKATTLSVWELNYLLSKLTVREIMARPVITASEGEYMEDAALRMQEHKVDGLPVINKDGQLSGMITTMDVLRAFTNILGLQDGEDGGQRLTLIMPDVPGSIERAARAVQPSNIISLATFEAKTAGQRRFVLRLSGDGVSNAAERVKEAGIQVLE